MNKPSKTRPQPVNQPVSTTITPAPPERTAPAFAPPGAILLATADDLIRRQIVPLLEADGCMVRDCDRLESLAALLAGDGNTPDLIILDDRLPGEVDPPDDPALIGLQQVQARFSPDPIPVIMVLSDDRDERIQPLFDLGATDYVTCPLRPLVLRQRVRYLLHMRAMQTSLREKEARYRIISNSISDYAYAYSVNPDGSLVKDWNTRAFETITGYERHELVGDGWSILIHPDDLGLALERYHRLLAGQKDVSEFRIITRSGEVRWLQDHGQPVFDERQGRVVRIYGAAKDITERKRVEELMRTRTEELQERNQELDSFAHTVAHDLKNPISSMMGFASLVLNYYDRMTDDRIKEYLLLIMEGGYKLKEIINSLLLLASVNRLDKITLSPLDMREIIQETQRRMLTMIAEQEAQIIEPEHYPVAVGYAPWVEEVWANYLSNALKYGGTPPYLELGADTLNNGMIRFWIIDNGTGLTPEEQAEVFTPFTRMNQAKIEGHGLGLSVVHRIVSRLGGEVGVETAYTGGCKFYFTLPAATADDEDEG